MSHLITPSDIIVSARSWVGVPFQHQGRTRKGVDCVGLLVNVAKELGVEHEDRVDYPRQPNEYSLLNHLKRYLLPVPGNVKVPGRIALMRDSLFPCHVGILSEKNGHLYLIHARADRRKVVEEPLEAAEARCKFVAAYDLPGVTR